MNIIIQNQLEMIYIIKRKLNKKFEEININKEIQYNNGKYIGQVINGLKEGKGIMYRNDDDRYEGKFKNIKWKEKEYIILTVVIDMMVI